MLRAYLSVRRSAEDVEGGEDLCLRSSTPPAPLSSAQLERDMIFQSPCCRALVSSPGVEPCWNLVAVGRARLRSTCEEPVCAHTRVRVHVRVVNDMHALEACTYARRGSGLHFFVICAHGLRWMQSAWFQWGTGQGKRART